MGCHPASAHVPQPGRPALGPHQEGTEHVEANEVVVGEVGATGALLPRGVVRLGVAQLAVAAGQQDLLPRLTRGTPGRQGAVRLSLWAAAESRASGGAGRAPLRTPDSRAAQCEPGPTAPCAACGPPQLYPSWGTIGRN